MLRKRYDMNFLNMRDASRSLAIEIQEKGTVLRTSQKYIPIMSDDFWTCYEYEGAYYVGYKNTLGLYEVDKRVVDEFVSVTV